eukprot:2582374-Rhodomonas_salina.3
MANPEGDGIRTITISRTKCVTDSTVTIIGVPGYQGVLGGRISALVLRAYQNFEKMAEMFVIGLR